MKVRELRILLEGVNGDKDVLVYDSEYDDWFMTDIDRIKFE